MNYRELSQYASVQNWAAQLKETIDARNKEILAARQAYLDHRTGPGVGDFIVDGDKVLRVAHHWGDSLQPTDGRFGASFYLGDGYVDFSGGLDPAIPLERFVPTDETRMGRCWLFSDNSAEAHNGYYTQARFRVWKLA